MKYLLFFFPFYCFACQSPDASVKAANLPLTDSTIVPEIHKNMEINSLGLEVRVRYHHDEHSRDSYSVTEIYTLKGLVLTKTTSGTGRMKKPESSEVYGLSEADVQKLYQLLSDKQLLRNEKQNLDIPKDAWTTSMSLIIKLKDTTYQLSISGDAHDVEASSLYKELYKAFFQMQQFFKS